jgi:hypothetical protein
MSERREDPDDRSLPLGYDSSRDKPAGGKRENPVLRSRRRSRVAVAVMMVLSLIATAATRDWAISRGTERDRVISGQIVPVDAKQNASTTSLSSMPSFATALLLGGLRGPLVMILWTTSESQKQQRDLQDFDTKVEWIRLLQPEFDTVHLFQIWNKAYNISVQMSSLQNKYTTILDAIDYAQKVEQDRPDDISIISQVAQIYGDKLGNSTEHVYYRRMIRKQTQTLIRLSFPAARADEFRADAAVFGWTNSDAPVIVNDKTGIDTVLLEKSVTDELQKKFAGSGVTYAAETTQTHEDNPSWRRLRLDPMLDVNGNILPELLQVRYPRPASIGPNDPWYEGSKLQFLAKYQPFPYGLSTFALAYNDYKRAQMLQTVWNERHIQSSEIVVDSRPAIDQKLWAKDEWERGRKYEIRMWDLPPVTSSDDPGVFEGPSATIPPSKQVTDEAARQAAIYSYGLSARLFVDARAEFQHHMKGFPANAPIYFSHVDETYNGEYMMTADLDYLKATAATGDEQKQLLLTAGEKYTEALDHIIITFLEYYVSDTIAQEAFPVNTSTGQRLTRANIREVTDPGLLLSTWTAVNLQESHDYTDPQTHAYLPANDEFKDDRDEYTQYVGRCVDRLKILQAMLPAAAPATQLSMPTTRDIVPSRLPTAQP